MSQTTKFTWINSITVTPMEPLFIEVEGVIKELLTKSGRTYQFRRQPYPALEGDNGSLKQMQHMADNMVRLAHQLYMNICINKDSLDGIHLIASRTGAAFALKFLIFFNHFGFQLELCPVRKFDGIWNVFSLSDTACGDPNPLFRSLTIIQPSLPCPGLFTRLLALPDIEGLDTADLNIKIQGRGTKTTTFSFDELTNINIKKVGITVKEELSSFWNKNPPEEKWVPATDKM